MGTRGRFLRMFSPHKWPSLLLAASICRRSEVTETTLRLWLYLQNEELLGGHWRDRPDYSFTEWELRPSDPNGYFGNQRLDRWVTYVNPAGEIDGYSYCLFSRVMDEFAPEEIRENFKQFFDESPSSNHLRSDRWASLLDPFGQEWKFFIEIDSSGFRRYPSWVKPGWMEAHMERTNSWRHPLTGTLDESKFEPLPGSGMGMDRYLNGDYWNRDTRHELSTMLPPPPPHLITQDPQDWDPCLLYTSPSPRD